MSSAPIPSLDSGPLPVDDLRPELLRRLEVAPVVLTSPTGSGKSTQVPRWCPGPVLVIEPRRVACRSLAQRVASLEGCTLGREVGYHVRDERRVSGRSRIVFATPGVVLRLGKALGRYATIVVDEYHERGLEVDLLLALLLARRRAGELDARLVVMSATLEAERLADHLGGHHLHTEGRTFPVSLEYLAGGALLPDLRGLEERLLAACERIATRERAGGLPLPEASRDLLVFLPGKGEIATCQRALGGSSKHGLGPLELLPLHGGLSLDEQNRVFEPSTRRKVILATNVAETSLTVPGVGIVVDSGLVRQTRYARDRGFLTLVPVALDSAEQRRGRAGRTAPGHCLRLWSEAARLEARTPPELHRESLVQLVLAAAVHGHDPAALPFVDPPKEHALETARRELRALAALDPENRLTERGRRLFGLPLDATLGRLLVEAEEREKTEPGILRDTVDLVSALSLDRRLVTPPPAEEIEKIDDACDAVASLRALRGTGGPEGAVQGLRRRVHRGLLAEAKTVRRRLRHAFGLEGDGLGGSQDSGWQVDRRRLALALLAADRRLAHVARRRGKAGARKVRQRVGWSNGGTELEMGRDTSVDAAEEAGLGPVEAVAVLSTLALGLGGRDTRLVATQVMPLELDWLVQARLGRERLANLQLETSPSGAIARVVARFERVYAEKRIGERVGVPEGEAARSAVTRLMLEGRLFRKATESSRARLEAVALAHRLAERESADRGTEAWLASVLLLHPEAPPPFERWLAERVEQLGVSSGEDVALLSPEDLAFPELPPQVREELDRAYPRRLLVEGVEYRVEYQLERSTVVLRLERGKPQKLPSRFFLPRFPGFRVEVEHKGVLRRLE